jgi:hypothetical protein
MMFIFQALVFQILLLFQLLNGQCPKYQRFAGSSSTTCALANQGVPFNFGCSTTVDNFAIAGWYKLPLDDSLFGETAKSDTYFTVMSPTESMKRFTLKYKFGTGRTPLTQA